MKWHKNENNKKKNTITFQYFQIVNCVYSCVFHFIATVCSSVFFIINSGKSKSLYFAFL